MARGPIDVTFTVNPTTPTAGTPADFSATVESSVTNATYQWTWGDGSTSTITGKTTNHTFATAKTYTVQLTVSTADGRSGNASRDVKVNP